MSNCIVIALYRYVFRESRFQGRWPVEYYHYRPVGMLYDVEELDQKQGKFVFSHDVSTSGKFWIGKNADSEVNKKEGRGADLTLQDLQRELNHEVDERQEVREMPFSSMQHAPNEMLMGVRKSALKAFFSPGDTNSDRVRTFLQVVYRSQDDGIHVPMLIIDGKSPPRVYSMECLDNDLKELIKSSKKEDREFVENLALCFLSKTELKTLGKTPELINRIKEKCRDAMDLSIFPDEPKEL